MLEKIKVVVESKSFQNFIMGVIILNGITMGFETSKYYALEYYTFFEVFNFSVVTIFTIEIIMRISVCKTAFFKDPWSLFDFFLLFSYR